MKKHGFTLAEILITLGIIGVVAALTAPSLVQNAGSAKVGPTLAKVKTTIEVANEQLMHDRELNSLASLSKPNSGTVNYVPTVEHHMDEYVDAVAAYMKGVAVIDVSYSPAPTYINGDPISALGSHTNHTGTESKGLMLSNGTTVNFSDRFSVLRGEGIYRRKGSYNGTKAEAVVDINGPTVGPNVVGKDLFVFVLDDSGVLVPVGGAQFKYLLGDNYYSWEATEGDFACNEDVIGTGVGCAGAIFDNNLKVTYQ